MKPYHKRWERRERLAAETAVYWRRTKLGQPGSDLIDRYRAEICWRVKCFFMLAFDQEATSKTKAKGKRIAFSAGTSSSPGMRLSFLGIFHAEAQDKRHDRKGT